MRALFAIAICLMPLIVQSCDYPSTPVTPTFADYDRIAFGMMPSDIPPAFMRGFKSILTVCMGDESSSLCDRQTETVLNSRGLLARKQGNDYALFLTTKNENDRAKVTISLTSPDDEIIYQYSAEIIAADQMKAASNIRATLAWKFATKWAIANHRPPRLVDLQSFLDL